MPQETGAGSVSTSAAGGDGLDVAELRALDGSGRVDLVEALESAFPSWNELTRLVARLDRKLRRYGSPSDPIGDVAFTVVERAREDDWLVDLVREAVRVNPENVLLREFVAAHQRGGGAAAGSVGAAAAPGVPALAGPPPSDEEILGELGDAFDDREVARNLVASMGFARGRQPGFTIDKAYLYWSEVKRQLDLGAVRDAGWPDLVRVAAQALPGNKVFAAAEAATSIPGGGNAPVASRNTPLPFAVFISYTHQSDPSGVLGRFLDELRDAISIRTGVAQDQTLFIDTTMPVSGRWSKRIIHALATCRVFMPIYSPSYPTSDFCGREWTVFARRLRAYSAASGDDADAVVPVLWTPVTDIADWVGRAPFAPLQYVSGHADYHQYRDRGIYGLSDDERKKVTFYLAGRVAEAYRDDPVPPADPTMDYAAFTALPTWENVV